MNNKIYSLVCMFLIVIINLVGFVSAESVDYQIFEDKVLVELKFDSVDNFELRIPHDAEALELNIAKSDYVLEDRDYDKLIMINSAENVEIKYITKSYLETSGGKYFFILKNSFDDAPNISLYLPEGAVLEDSITVFPKADETVSDGRRIILKWNDFDDEQILVNYEFLRENNWFTYIVALVIIIALIVFYINEKRRFKIELKKVKKTKKKKIDNNKKEQELTKNLFEDEKKIVKYLLNKKDNESWTKEMLRDLEISKVKLSRKLRSLEQKEVIKRVPYGNENKIRLLR